MKEQATAAQRNTPTPGDSPALIESGITAFQRFCADTRCF